MLKKGRPIMIDLADLGLYVGGISVFIFYGVTEKAMQAQLQEYINKDTLIFESGKEGNGH
jgi:hypothetical protein